MSLISRRVAVNGAAASFALIASGIAVFSQTKTLIGVAMPQDDNPFYIVMLKGIRARAAELGWDVASVSSNEDKMKQISGVQDLIARGVKGILISPIDAVGVNAAYIAAAEAKIPIISLARGAASPAQTYYVPMDEKQVGRDIAEWTAKNIGGEGKVALLLGPAGAPTFRNLAAGYMEMIEKNPKISVAFRTDGPLTRERGLHNAEDAIVAHPDLKAIYCANDDVALGALQAVVAAGKQGQIRVTGMNGVPPALKSIREGNLAMTVELNPYQWGSLGVDVMKAFIDGTPPKSQTFVPHKLIDKDNIDDVLKAK